jgi:predicted enzyme related to lactoylglutathione lyase
MSANQDLEAGRIGWVDLTVANAAEIRDFYTAVVGWRTQEVEMAGYRDFAMQAPGSGDSIAGVCWARGENAELPPVWLIYLMVDDLDASMAKVKELGGRVLVGPRKLGPTRYCVIEDPAGAKSALMEIGGPEA